MLRKDIRMTLDMSWDTFSPGKPIYDYLSTMSDGWIYVASTLDSLDNAAEYIVRRSHKNPQRGYGFRFGKHNASNGTVQLQSGLVEFENETSNTVINGAMMPTDPLLGYSSKPKYTNAMDCRVTISVGKQDKTASISVVPNGSGYVLMNGVCGEDSNEDPFALLPSKNYITAGEPPMHFITYVNANTWGENQFDYDSTGSESAFFGFISSSKLILSPCFNPITGALCHDLYIPISGPQSTQLYNISMGGRTFITGASNPEASVGSGIGGREYNAFCKVFLEV